MDKSSESFQVMRGLYMNSNDFDKSFSRSPMDSVELDTQANKFIKRNIDVEKKQKTQSVPFYKLFSFADSIDIALMVMGTIGALANGITVPILSVLLGRLTDAFGGDIHHVVDRVGKVSLQYIYLAIWTGATSFLQMSCWKITGERQAMRIRKLYLKSLLSQEIAFFDSEVSTGEIIGRMTGDSVLVQDAMSEKVGSFIQQTCTVCGGFILAFKNGWILTLVMVSIFVPIGLCIAVMSNLSMKMAPRALSANAKASEIVQQTVSSIRTVASYTGEKLSVKNYRKALRNVCKYGIIEGLVGGLCAGIIMFLNFCSLSLGFWYGAKMIIENGKGGGTIVTTVISVFMSTICLLPLSPCMASFAVGQVAAHKMFETINRTPEIDASDPNGIILDNIQGEIEFRNVHFSYPTRPMERIFKGLSFSVQKGTTFALVGSSGSGKSTVISMIERFYDPHYGQVLIDRIDIKQFQLRWLRGKIGQVSQEPALFSSSIRDNISYSKANASDEEITAAVELSNASIFISKLPQGLDTMVGERGIQLSGGQKQRIALARAILNNPIILLLDEATSALDVESELAVQVGLERVMKKCTTVIVAHRLSTVRNADSIAVMQQGTIVERGSHSELLNNANGVYSKLIHSQQMNQNLDHEEFEQSSRNISLEFQNSREYYSAERFWNADLNWQWSQSIDTKTVAPVQKPYEVPLRRLAELNRPEIPFLLIGSIAAIINGLAFPISAVLLSTVIATFYEPPDKLKKGATFLSTMYLVTGAVGLVVIPMKSCFFAIAGAKLIRRIRSRAFRKVVNMDISWFDDQENSTGAIGTRLSTDAAAIKGLVGDALATHVEIITTMIAGLAFAFAACWQISLLILTVVPIIFVNGWLQMKICAGIKAEAKKMYEEAGVVASDALGSIRTVASLSAEEKVMVMYTDKCRGPVRAGIREGVAGGAAFGISFLLLFFVYAVTFYVGAHLVASGKTTIGKIFQAFFSISMSFMEITRASAQKGDSDKARASANSIFAILDHKCLINPNYESGSTLRTIEGNIEFKNVTFRYPTRPDTYIFRDLSLAIKSKKTVAIVGESGSGKSTMIALLQRFYDPNSGNISIDGIEIQKFKLQWLRQQMGLVSQEPVLFNDTIWANIAFGMERKVDAVEVANAAKLANAHVFISSMSQGYQSIVGEQGVKLCGGHKQRIAIARAILKQPKILLLDEATSALDIESERIVQKALDNVMVDRTTIVVAHRLATIKNVDFIVVMKNGEIVERGKHETLVQIKDGVYASMASLHSTISS